MKQKVALVSIPHSGTIFLSDFLEKVVGLRHVKDYNEFMDTEDTDVFIRMHTNAPLSSYHNTHIWEHIFQNCHIIAPLRHPHQVFISHLAREYPNAMDMVVESWKNMIEVVNEAYVMMNEVHMVHIDTHNRLETMNKLVEHMECYPPHDLFVEFVAEWKKVNTVPNHNDVRRAYNTTGRLLTAHDYSRLDDAVGMYKQWAEV